MTNPGAPPVVAVDVGGTSIKGALAVGSDLFASRRRAVRGLGADEVVAATVSMVDELVQEAGRHGVAAAVGLAVPGLVDERAGIGLSSMLLGWRDVPFVNLVRESTGLPVAFSHDVSAGAYAEARAGAALGHRDWLFLALGTGLGSTFVFDDRPYRGTGGTGGELAHVVVRPDGPRCRCGKHGCLEMIATAAAIADNYRARTGRDVDAAQVAAFAGSGDAAARSVWDDAIDALATVVASYAEALNPSVVVVGGGLARAGAALMDPLSAAIHRRVAFADPVPEVSPAAFTDEAALVGVALAAASLATVPAATHATPFEIPPAAGL